MWVTKEDLFTSVQVRMSYVYGVCGGLLALRALAVLLTAFFWALLWGPIGLVLSTPSTVCLVVMASQVPRLGSLHVILGGEVSCEPNQRHRRCRSFKDSGARHATSQIPDWRSTPARSGIVD
jgi:hypothetical protein